MIGEISCAINRVEEQIEQLFDEKEEFIMANEDVLPRTMYLKKLAEIDSRIDELKKTLVSLNEETRDSGYGITYPMGISSHFPPCHSTTEVKPAFFKAANPSKRALFILSG